MKKIHKATGISDVNRVVDAYENKMETHENLLAEVESKRALLEQLRQERVEV